MSKISKNKTILTKKYGGHLQKEGHLDIVKVSFLEKIESCKNSKMTNWNNGFRALCINDKSSDLVSHFQNGEDLSNRTTGGRAAGQKPAPGR
jgi:hypothetical protein